MNDVFQMKLYKVFLQFKRNSIQSECDILKEYLLTLHQLSRNETNKLELMVKEMVDRSPDNEDDIYEHFSEQHSIYKTKYVELANNTILVTAYSFLEFQLKEIQELVDEYVINKANINPRVTGSYANKAKLKIYGMSGLDFSTLEPLWIKMDKFRIIRNLITHNGANIYQGDGNREDIDNEAMMTQFPQIKIESNKDFTITDDTLVFGFIDTVEEYLRELVKILEGIDLTKVK